MGDMKIRRLTIDVLYNESDDTSVQIILDKMQSDWLHKEQIAQWESSLGAPHEDFSVDDWDYFWEYQEDTDEFLPVNREGLNLT